MSRLSSTPLLQYKFCKARAAMNILRIRESRETHGGRSGSRGGVPHATRCPSRVKDVAILDTTNTRNVASNEFAMPAKLIFSRKAY